MSLKDRYQVTNVFVSAVTPENISRQQLLAWVNDALQSNLTKIEEMSTGAAYCLLTDRLFPGSIPLQKVKWNAKNDLEAIANWKLVQNAWHDLGITKPVQVQTLLKGKFQDNFEFLQWFKRFYDHNNAGYDYDPLAARNNEPFPISAGARGSKVPTRAPTSTTTAASRRTTMMPSAIQNSSRPAAAPAPNRRITMAPRPATTANQPKPDVAAQIEAKYRAEIKELKEQIATWENTLSSLERERDYYYQRLHKLELLCNNLQPEDTVAVSKILAVLYQEEEDPADLQDFEAVEEKILHEVSARETAEHDAELTANHAAEAVENPPTEPAEKTIDHHPIDKTIDLANETADLSINTDKAGANGTFVKPTPTNNDTVDLVEGDATLKSDAELTFTKPTVETGDAHPGGESKNIIDFENDADDSTTEPITLKQTHHPDQHHHDESAATEHNHLGTNGNGVNA